MQPSDNYFNDQELSLGARVGRGLTVVFQVIYVGLAIWVSIKTWGTGWFWLWILFGMPILFAGVGKWLALWVAAAVAVFLDWAVGPSIDSERSGPNDGVEEATVAYYPTDQMSFALDSELALSSNVDESPDIARAGTSDVDTEIPGSSTDDPTDRSSFALDRTPELPPRSDRGPDILDSVSVAPAAGKAKVVVLTSAMGGSGKTVTATNLGVLLAQRGDAPRVCIVDADLQFGDVCLALSLEPESTVVDAAHELHRLDEPLLESLLTTHPSELRVLAAPLEPAFADEISTAAMTEIITKLGDLFDYIIIDTATLLDELKLSLLRQAHQVLFIVDMDLPSVKNAKLTLETLRSSKLLDSKVCLVLNRSKARAPIKREEIERLLKLKVSAAIPSDESIPASINEGRPVVESAPRSRTAEALKTVCDLVVG